MTKNTTKKTIVGTNTSLGGAVVSTTVDANPKVVNNLNVNIGKGTDITQTPAQPSQGVQSENGTVAYPQIDQEQKEVQPIDPIPNYECQFKQCQSQYGNPYGGLSQYPKQTPSQFLYSDVEILGYLCSTFQNIIVDDSGCIMNIVDRSGLIILPPEKLIKLIAMVAQITEDNVKIEILYEDEETDCCGKTLKKLTPLKEIAKIKIKKDTQSFVDFQLMYNGLYNKITDEYKVSLERIYEKIL